MDKLTTRMAEILVSELHSGTDHCEGCITLAATIVEKLGIRRVNGYGYYRYVTDWDACTGSVQHR